MGRHLARNNDHGNRVHERSGDAGHCIGNARAARDKGDTDTTRGARIAIRSVYRSLLMTHQDMLDFVLVKECVVNVKHRAARITEDVVNAFILQATDGYFSTGKLHFDRFCFSRIEYINVKRDFGQEQRVFATRVSRVFRGPRRAIGLARRWAVRRSDRALRGSERDSFRWPKHPNQLTCSAQSKTGGAGWFLNRTNFSRIAGTVRVVRCSWGARIRFTGYRN